MFLLEKIHVEYPGGHLGTLGLQGGALRPWGPQER